MRTISTDLFDLIHSLSANDKRMFKLYAQVYSASKGEKSYIKLFDIIESQSEYNEEIVKKKLNNESFNSQPSPFKNHLFKLIIKVLAPAQDAIDISIEVNQEISSINFLYQKQLYKPAFAAFKRLWSELEELEEFNSMIFMLHFRHKLYQVFAAEEHYAAIRQFPIMMGDLGNRHYEQKVIGK